MNLQATLSRKRWLAVMTVIVLAALALTAGILFAANEPGPPSVAVPPDPASERILAQAGDNQEQISLPPIAKEPPRYPNLDSNLNRLAEESETISNPESPDADPSSQPAEPALVTFYVEPEHVAGVREYLKANGIFVRNVGEDYIEAHVPPRLLGAASEQPGVLRVDNVIPPQPAQSRGDVFSQGVALHEADHWHSAGYRGQGVKVGVIDGGFEGFSQLQGSELPRNVTARCYFAEARAPSSSLSDCGVGSSHGTAVAETVVDVAPDVELYIANPQSLGDLRNAVDWMTGQGVKVINRSQSDVYQGPGDGKSPFSNSVFSSVDAAVSGGALWVNSGGNGAQRVWYGTFSDPDNDGVHNFAPQDEGNAFVVSADSTVTAFMRWDDIWGQADCDLDLGLYRGFVDSTDYQLVDEDVEIQDGGAGDIPRAVVQFDVGTISEREYYFLVIRKHTCANVPDYIQLTAFESGPFQYYSSGHHIGNPAESRNQGMLAVGAAHWENPGSIAPYSSRGPTIDGRIKPDITGISCGRSTVYDLYTRGDDGTQCWFGGTSQAAPHVAGLAAVVKQRFPNYSPARVATYLTENASERGPAGADNTWGIGLAALPDPSIEPVLGPTGNIAVRDGAVSGEVIVSWDAVPEATHYRIGYVNMETDYVIAKARPTGDWIEAFIYVDVNAVNFPPVSGRVEYTVPRLASGVRHAFTVLTSNDTVSTSEYISGRFNWPSNPRWQFHTVGTGN